MDRYKMPNSVAREFFAAYTDFLTMLDQETQRKALDQLRSTESRTDTTFQRIRQISKAFEHALDYIFFENAQVAPLTRKYGVF
jgi:hypothetical protein